MGGQPFICLGRLREIPRNGQSHGRLHVVPGIGLLTVAPRNFAAGPLGPRDQRRRRLDVDRLRVLRPESIQVEFHALSLCPQVEAV